MKVYEGVEVQMHVLLTSALVGGEWLALRPCRFTPAEMAPMAEVHPIAGLNIMEKLKFLSLPWPELRPSMVQPVASHYTDYATATGRKLYSHDLHVSQCVALGYESNFKLFCLLPHTVVYSLESQSTFRRNISSAIPASKHGSGCAWCLHLSGFRLPHSMIFILVILWALIWKPNVSLKRRFTSNGPDNVIPKR
jgi:hypothetical protein